MATGTKFYQQKGYKTIIAYVPRGTKAKASFIASSIGCSQQELYNDILKDYLSNKKGYDLNKETGEESITIYIPENTHRQIKGLCGIKGDKLKYFTAKIIVSFLEDRSEAKSLFRGNEIKFD